MFKRTSGLFATKKSTNKNMSSRETSGLFDDDNTMSSRETSGLFDDDDSMIKSKDEEKDEKIEDEYIWVEGYKVTNKNMCGLNDFKYEFGKTYKQPSNTKFGFYLYLDFGDCLKHNDINNRFFKVKALVNKKNWELVSMAKVSGYKGFYDGHENTYMIIYDSAIDAKEIEFLEELDKYNDITKKYIKEKFSWVETEDDILYIANNSISNSEFIREKFIRKMKELNFSDSYIMIKANEISYLHLKVFYDTAKSLIDEKVSKDMLIYLLENKKLHVENRDVNMLRGAVSDYI